MVKSGKEMNKQTFIIDVTQKDIKAVQKYKKKYGECVFIGNSCPVARALKRTIGNGVKHVNVGVESIGVEYKSGSHWNGELSKTLMKKIAKFDATNNMAIGHHKVVLYKAE